MNGEDEKYRSRKWILAQRVLRTATWQHWVFQTLIFAAMVIGKLGQDVWAGASRDLFIAWIGAASLVLGLYGLANVFAIKFSNGGGVG